MASIQVNFSDLEGHFCCLKPLCPSATVVRVHDGVICGVVNNTGGSRRWFIKVTFQLTSTRLVVWMSVDDTHGITCWLYDSCAQCNDTCTKLCRYRNKKVTVGESAVQADTRSVCVIRTPVGQYFNWYRASRGSLSGSLVYLLDVISRPMLVTSDPKRWFYLQADIRSINQ